MPIRRMRCSRRWGCSERGPSEALGRTKELIRAYISSSEVEELRAANFILTGEKFRITEACEEFEHAVREMLEAAPQSEKEAPAEEEEDVNQDEQEAE